MTATVLILGPRRDEQARGSSQYDALVADSNPPDGPFGGLPFFGDLSKMFAGAGAGPWETARQLAAQIATNGESEPNVDPVERLAIEQLVRVAELRVNDLTGRTVGGAEGLGAEITNRAGWAIRTVADYQPLLQGLSDALARPPQEMPEVAADDPMSGMFAAVFGMLGPMMLGFTSGSMVGHLAQRSLGGYSLPVPRPTGSPLLLSVPVIDELVDDWSLDRNDVRLWTCLHEVATHAVLGVSHVHEALTDLLTRYVGGFQADPSALEAQLGSLDLSDPASLSGLQERLGDPDVILGALSSPEQHQLQPQLAALTAVVVGVADHLVDRVGHDLIGTHAQITEAIHRQRVSAGTSDRFVERLLGLELDQAQYDRGAAFVRGVREREGDAGLFRIFHSARELPTVAEVDAPGLWLARIDLPEGG
jgi:putative hydrolase